jgi:hypothetical protein
MMLSVPHNGQATLNRPTVVLEATTGVFIAGPFLPAPSELRPVPKPVRYMPRWYADFRPVTLVPIWAIHTRQCRVAASRDSRHQAGSSVLVAAR